MRIGRSVRNLAAAERDWLWANEEGTSSNFNASKAQHRSRRRACRTDANDDQ